MSLETQVAALVTATDSLTGTVNTKIADIDSAKNTAVAAMDARVGTFNSTDLPAMQSDIQAEINGSMVTNWHVSGMTVLTSPKIVDPGMLVGSETQTAFGDQTGDMGQPHVYDEVIGHNVPDVSIRKNIFEAAGATPGGFAQPSIGHNMYTGTVNSNGCSFDMNLVGLGMNLGSGRANSFPNYKWNDEGRMPYLVMRIAIDGSNHSANPTVVAFGSPHTGNYNGGWYQHTNPLTTGDHGGIICGKISGRQWASNTTAQLQADASLTKHGCFTIHAAGYGFGNLNGNYGSWIAIPLNEQHYRGNSNRLWNVGFKRLAISAYGIAWTKPWSQA